MNNLCNENVNKRPKATLYLLPVSVASPVNNSTQTTPLKSVHFKKTVARSSFLSKIVVLVVVVLKSTTILKEMRIAQLSLHHQQTQNETTGFCLTLGSGQTSAAVCSYDILAKVNPPFCFLRLLLSSFRLLLGCANRLWLWQLGDDENKCDDLRFNPPLQAPCLCTSSLCFASLSYGSIPILSSIQLCKDRSRFEHLSHLAQFFGRRRRRRHRHEAKAAATADGGDGTE